MISVSIDPEYDTPERLREYATLFKAGPEWRFLTGNLDNVIAVAAAAKGDLGLVIFGILVSIPIVVWGSKFVLKLMDRLPVVISFGGALLGWIAGDMLLGDAVVKPYLEGQPGWLKYAASTAGALLVMAIGTWLAKRAPRPQPPVEVVASGAQGDREHE